jgi:hypothetical protein
MPSRPENSDDAAQRMLGAVPAVPALGRGPRPTDEFARHDYHHPAAGWDPARSVGDVMEKAGEPVEGFRALFRMNQRTEPDASPI